MAVQHWDELEAWNVCTEVSVQNPKFCIQTLNWLLCSCSNYYDQNFEPAARCLMNLFCSSATISNFIFLLIPARLSSFTAKLHRINKFSFYVDIFFEMFPFFMSYGYYAGIIDTRKCLIILSYNKTLLSFFWFILVFIYCFTEILSLNYLSQ